MIDLLGRMFGSEKAIEKTIDTVSNGLDKLYYSDEEKANDAAKSRTEARGMLIKWMESTQGQTLTRRTIAFAVIYSWLTGILLSKLFQVLSTWVEEPTKYVETAKQLGELSTNMDGVVMLVIGFYFALPHLDKFIPKGKSDD